MECDLNDIRRLTIDPPLTEAEFARFCGANPGLKIARGPNGLIVSNRKRKGRDGCVDSLLSQWGTVNSDIDLDDDRVKGRTEIRRGSPDTESLEAREAQQVRLNRKRESLGPLKQYADTATMRVHIKPRCLREALGIPFLRMIEKTGRVLDDSTQKEWLDDAEQRLRSVISRIDPVPVSYGYVAERDANGLTIHTVTGLKVAKHAIGQLSSGEWPCWNEIIEAVPEFDMTLVVFDAGSRREWLRRWDMRIQQHRIQAEYGIFA